MFGELPYALTAQGRFEREGSLSPYLVERDVTVFDESQVLIIHREQHAEPGYYTQKFREKFAAEQNVTIVHVSMCNIPCSEIATLAVAMRNNSDRIRHISIDSTCEQCITDRDGCAKLIATAFLRALRLAPDLHCPSDWHIVSGTINIHEILLAKAIRAAPTMLDILDAARDHF